MAQTKIIHMYIELKIIISTIIEEKVNEKI